MSRKKTDFNGFYVGFPKSFNEIKYYAAELLEERSVVINLSSLSKEDREKCRLFMAGLVFGIRGKMEDIAEDVLLVLPSTTELMKERGVGDDTSLFPIEP